MRYKREVENWLTTLVIVGTKSAEHSLRTGSESHCLLRQLNKILEISDSEASLKMEKSGGAFGEGECGDAEVELFVRDRPSLDIRFRYQRLIST